MSSWSSKKELRSLFKSLCAQEFARSLVQNQQQFALHLHDFMSKQSGVWGAYRALPQEISVDEVFNIKHIEWLFPRVIGTPEVRHLEFCRAHSFSQGAFGILEPDKTSPIVDVHDMSGLLIPALAFNKNGHRLGKGKGYYDRTLEHFTGMKVGVCFDFQISEADFPFEEHDVRMDVLITDSQIIDCRPGR